MEVLTNTVSNLVLSFLEKSTILKSSNIYHRNKKEESVAGGVPKIWSQFLLLPF